MYDENVVGFVFFLFQGRVVYIRRRCGNVAVAAGRICGAAQVGDGQ